MGNFLTSSIGKKVIMSLSGLFLISFLCIHLALNLLMLVDSSGDLFNQGAHFMATNPLIKIVEPILMLGFVIHILWASILTLQNRKARPTRYAMNSQSQNATWSSRNMYILGAMILVFLVIHMYNFWINIKLPAFGNTALAHIVVDGVKMEDTYTLVADLFRNSIAYCVLYIAGAILLGLHITHGFWSAFQSVGFSNAIWRKRLECVAYFFAIVFALGFGIIPIYFIIVG